MLIDYGYEFSMEKLTKSAPLSVEEADPDNVQEDSAPSQEEQEETKKEEGTENKDQNTEEDSSEEEDDNEKDEHSSEAYQEYLRRHPEAVPADYSFESEYDRELAKEAAIEELNKITAKKPNKKKPIPNKKTPEEEQKDEASEEQLRIMKYRRERILREVRKRHPELV